jgi:hypothetical protein
MAIDSITFRNKNFGSLITELNYENRNVALDVRFIELIGSKPGLTITGNIPIDLSLTDVEDRMLEEEMDIRLLAKEFNLGAFGDILPGVNKLSGLLNSELTINGTLETPRPNGFLRVSNSSFLIEANNLEYVMNMGVTVSPEKLSLDSLRIGNVPNTEWGGVMTAWGSATLNELDITASQFSLNGQLKVLDEVSRTASPSVYGDLVIATDGNVEFTFEEGNTVLKAPVVVKRANLTFPPTQSAYQNANENFIYKYADYGTDTTRDRGFEGLIRLSQQRGAQERIAAQKESSFDYSIDIRVEREARIIFVISREFNQNLTAVLEGNFKYESVSGRTSAIGELNLLEGSTLEFFRTLIADGSIRFEKELDNPYLNITATYRDYYQPPTSTSPADETEVAVKIKIEGFLEELDQKFVKAEDNLAVYYGTENIENDIPDRTKTESDAVMFLLTGKFAEDLTQAERQQASNTIAGPATSLAGSVLGGFLNRHLGEYVRSVELRRVGTETRFSLQGRAGNFKYTVGGTSGVFQDIGQANIKIEYPIIRGLLLRLERREDVTETNISNEMINEVGLKYKFEF